MTGSERVGHPLSSFSKGEKGLDPIPLLRGPTEPPTFELTLPVPMALELALALLDTMPSDLMPPSTEPIMDLPAFRMARRETGPAVTRGSRLMPALRLPLLQLLLLLLMLLVVLLLLEAGLRSTDVSFPLEDNVDDVEGNGDDDKDGLTV